MTKISINKVYFLQSSPHLPIKVGTTRVWRRRKNDYLLHLGQKPIILHVIDGTKILEREIHKKLAAHKVAGTREWFHFSPQLLEFISNFPRNNTKLQQDYLANIPAPGFNGKYGDCPTQLIFEHGYENVVKKYESLKINAKNSGIHDGVVSCLGILKDILEPIVKNKVRDNNSPICE